jgi:hypothetical protein
MIDESDYRYDHLRDLLYTEDQIRRLSDSSADTIVCSRIPPEKWDQ